MKIITFLFTTFIYFAKDIHKSAATLLYSCPSASCSGCSGHDNVTFPSTIKTIGSFAFSSCNTLVSVIIPTSVTSLISTTFYSTTSLKSVKIPTSIVLIGDAPFYGCSNLRSLTLPTTITTISNSFCLSCTSLTTMVIPTSVKSIVGYAFYGNSKLTTVYMPTSVTSIGQYAFANCITLKCIYWASNNGPTGVQIVSNAFLNAPLSGCPPTAMPTRRPTQLPSSQPSSQPSLHPTASPSYLSHSNAWTQSAPVSTRGRRAGGLCEHSCSHHGTCERNANCQCYPKWTGVDCSLRTCPADIAWVGPVLAANDLHPIVECSHKGRCERTTGECECFPGYEGIACQRTVCPHGIVDNGEGDESEEACSGRGACFPQRTLAQLAGKEYSKPWDALKQVGCYCDKGFRGPACELRECPSLEDPLGGYGNEAGRDCSGRGLCDYSSGLCHCFTGFFGAACNIQSTTE